MGRRERVQRQFVFKLSARHGAIMFIKAVAVAAIDRRNVKNFRVLQRLLNAGADGMRVIFGFDNRDGNIGFVIEDIIRPFSLPPAGQIASDVDFPVRKRDFFSDLGFDIPARCL